MSTTTDTGKPADPYKDVNLDNDVPLKEKVEDLQKFIESAKFCMMATRIASSGLIVSRCMALAAKVLLPLPLLPTHGIVAYIVSIRNTTASTWSSTPTPHPASSKISTRIQISTLAS